MSDLRTEIQNAKKDLAEIRQQISTTEGELEPIARQLRSVASDIAVVRKTLEPKAGALRALLADLKLEEARLTGEVVQKTKDLALSEYNAATAEMGEAVGERNRFMTELRDAMERALEPVRLRVSEATEREKLAKAAWLQAQELTPAMI